jgi:hypothetical protein
MQGTPRHAVMASAAQFIALAMNVHVHSPSSLPLGLHRLRLQLIQRLGSLHTRPVPVQLEGASFHLSACTISPLCCSLLVTASNGQHALGAEDVCPEVFQQVL